MTRQKPDIFRPFWTALELRRWLEPERSRIIPGTVAMLVVGLSALAIPIALKRVIEVLMTGAPAARPLLESAAVLTLLFLLNGIAGYFQGVLFHESAARIAERMRRALVGRWLRWSLARHHRHDIGSLLTVVTADVEAVYGVVAHGLAPLVQNGLTLGGGLLLIAWIHWPIALGLLVVLGAPAVWVRWHSRKVTAAFRQSREALEQAAGTLQGALASIVDVKLYRAEAEIEAAISSRLEAGARARIDAQRRQSASSQVLYVMFCLMTLVVFVGGGLRRLEARLELPSLLVLFLYAYAVAHASISLYRTLGIFREARPALERISGMLEEPCEPWAALETGLNRPAMEETSAPPPRLDGGVDGGSGPPLEPTHLPPGNPAGALSVRDLHFRYPGQAEPLLEGVSLEVPAGAWVVISGPSGTGKSTLLALMARLYPIEQGEVRVDGQPLEAWPVDALRRHIAVAPQTAGVFPGAVEQNVRLGRDIRDEVVRWALEVAQLPDLQALDARAENLSGGQRARLGIARALAGEPSILALDEATGALDADTELRFWRALAAVARHRTTLIVTHRPERVPDCDAVYRLEDRRLVRVDIHGTEQDAREAPAPVRAGEQT